MSGGVWLGQSGAGGVRRLQEVTSGVLHTLQNSAVDNGAGGIVGGSINYATGALAIKLTETYAEAVYNANGTWTSQNKSETCDGNVTVTYMQDNPAGTARQEVINIPSPKITFMRGITDDLIPGTVRFTLGGKAYSDRSGQGTLYWTDGTVAGSIDYIKREATITDWSASVNTTVNITSLLSTYGNWYQDAYHFRTNGSPLQPGSMLINATDTDGNLITATADFSGNLTGGGSTGTIDQVTGVCEITYPTPVFPNTVRYNAVIYTILPLDAEILGLDPVRLPSDGRVPIFRPADVGILVQNDSYTLPSGLVADQVVALPDDQLAACTLEDQAGTAVPTSEYSVNLATGAVTMNNPLDLTGLNEPLIAVYRVEDMRLISDVQINGAVTFTSAVYHDFDPAKSVLASALIHGDLQARYHTLFDQATWTGTWSDERIGSDPVASYNDSAYPLAVDNRGAIKERWLIKFTSSSVFEVIGETVGLIATGNIAVDLAPLNPESGTPYFTIYAGGWGSGWATGNCVRFNTEAGAAPMWIARTTLSGDATEEEDSLTLWHMGDAD
ncbi:hypothetical protein [Sedimenticola hydrogenitrophicus]|uniref:hypothetical protein n=1 Tax=Sedimenticola hydrogenitrophicus TaxID=2967975 RepID=UPI0023B0DEEF|nr:hypothetical protein [Sedimenticola hydrogenitrophicus]